MNNRFVFMSIFGLMLAACNSALAEESLLAPFVGVTPTATTASSTMATLTGYPLLGSSESPTPFIVTSFADLPGNEASGEIAKDFSADLVGGGKFSLLEQGEDYILVFPTVIGCSGCLFAINEIAIANEAYKDSGLKVLILDLWVDDEIDNWQYFADLVDQPNFLWGVVTSESFAADYNILGLGTTY